MPKGCAFSAKVKWELREADTHLGQRPCGRANRPDTNPQPTGQFRLKSALDPWRAFSNRSTPVKVSVYVARPGHGSLRGQRGLPQHLVRSGGQALQGPQRAYVYHVPIGPPRNCLHPRPGAMRVKCLTRLMRYAAITGADQRNGSPDRQTLCRITDNLRAKATRALPEPERRSIASAQSFRCSGRFTR